MSEERTKRRPVVVHERPWTDGLGRKRIERTIVLRATVEIPLARIELPKKPEAQ